MFVYATAESAEKAKSIAEILVEKKLVACVNIIPGAQSVYRWQGKVCSSQEAVMIMKTTRESVEKLKTEFKAQHSYECPALVFLDIQDGLPDYLRWIGEQAA